MLKSISFAVTFACLTSGAAAATLGFVNNSTTNSSDFASSVTTLGGTLNNSIDFDGMSTGALDGTFYSGSDGVTIVPGGAVGNVTFGAGPGQGNISGSQPGEGTHAASNYLLLGDSPSSLTFNFAQGVIGAGLFTIDAFNSLSYLLELKVEAFTGLNGTGTSLGSFSSVNQNFQRNNLYFMGITSDTEFRSFVFTDLTNNGGDIFGVDDFVFATGNTPAPVPVPAAGLLLLGALGMGAMVGRRRKT